MSRSVGLAVSAILGVAVLVVVAVTALRPGEPQVSGSPRDGAELEARFEELERRLDRLVPDGGLAAAEASRIEALEARVAELEAKLAVPGGGASIREGAGAAAAALAEIPDDRLAERESVGLVRDRAPVGCHSSGPRGSRS